MRKLIVSEFLSVDGVMEDPGGGDKTKFGGWTWPYSNQEIMKFKGEELAAGDALLLGRITYEGFAEAWPSRKGDAFSDKMNSMRKYVVTVSMGVAKWNNTKI